MPTLLVLFVLAASVLPATSASAFEPGEIDAAAVVSRAVETDVRWLTDDALEGRGSGSTGGALAEELLIDELALIGAGLDTSRSGRDAYRQDFGDGVIRTNLLAVIPGGANADEYVVIGAHYDHFAPNGCRVLDDPICNGATDNASGTSAVLAIGRAIRALPAPPSRSVVLALWDGEELGLLGSKYFAAHPLVPLADIAAYVNFDIQGSNLAPSAREMSFAIGAESGGELLTTHVQDAIDAVGLGTRQLTVTFGQARSDYQSFWSEDVPIVFFSDATNACYHSTSDDVDIVDFGKLSRQSEIGFRTVVALTEDVARPSFVPLVALDTYEDLLVLSAFLTRTLADLEFVDPSYQDDLVEIEATARERVENGEEAFTPTQALTVAQDALTIATNGIPCDPELLPEPGSDLFAAAALLAGVAIKARRR